MRQVRCALVPCLRMMFVLFCVAFWITVLHFVCIFIVHTQRNVVCLSILLVYSTLTHSRALSLSTCVCHVCKTHTCTSQMIYVHMYLYVISLSRVLFLSIDTHYQSYTHLWSLWHPTSRSNMCFIPAFLMGWTKNNLMNSEFIYYWDDTKFWRILKSNKYPIKSDYLAQEGT